MAELKKKNQGNNDRLLKRVNELGAIELSTFYTLAFAANGLTRKVAYKALQRLFVHDPAHKMITHEKVKITLGSLVDSGLVECDDFYRYAVVDALQDIACRMVARTGRAAVARYTDVIRSADPHFDSFRYGSDSRTTMQDMRAGIYLNDATAVIEADIEFERVHFNSKDEFHPIVRCFSQDFDIDWVESFHPDIVKLGIGYWLQGAKELRLPTDPLFEIIQSFEELSKEEELELWQFWLLDLFLMQGEFEKYLASAESLGSIVSSTAQGAVSFLQGDNSAALVHYEEAIVDYKKKSRRKNFCLPGIGGFLYAIALIKSSDAIHLAQANSYVGGALKSKDCEYYSEFQILDGVIQFINGSANARSYFDGYGYYHEASSWSAVWLKSLSNIWGKCDADAAGHEIQYKYLQECLDLAVSNGFQWVATEMAEVKAKCQKRSTKIPAIYNKMRQAIGAVGVVDALPSTEAWELSLRALAAISHQAVADGSEKVQTKSRLAWLASFSSGIFKLEPVEQKRKKKGWTKGRAVSLKKLANDWKKLDFLLECDEAICRSLVRVECERSWYYDSEEVYELDFANSLPHFAQHPNVFWEENRDFPVEIVQGQAELLVTKQKGKFRIQLDPFPQVLGEGHFEPYVHKETENRIRFVTYTDEQIRVAEVLGEKGKLFPESAVDAITKTVGGLNSLLPVHSETEIALVDVEVLKSDATIHVQMVPHGDGLCAELLTRPFTDFGSYCVPGRGRKSLLGKKDETQVRTVRNLKKETANQQELVDACYTFQRIEPDENRWWFDDPLDCLEALSELKALEEKITLLWPQGEKFNVTQPTSMSQFRVNIRSSKEWFTASGKLKVDNDRVLELTELFALMENSHGRFIELGDRQWLALTGQFRKRLDELKAWTDVKGGRAQFHPLAAISMQETLDEVGNVTTDKKWKEYVSRIDDARNFEPELPSTFHADLRDYQHDGYEWLSRLSKIGAGACLADDMGLGKTIQALALLVERAPHGPAIVVAPTSVCPNWLREAERFAPTLNVSRFGLEGANRKKQIETLEPHDVLVTSYGLLQNELEMFTSRSYQTIVLDEAQAIKNSATKRSKAVMALEGDFRLITTGTPIENHLGELWNLFRFINPGLLGSAKDFNLRFALPIEKDKNKQTRNHLKKLIQPYVLRRTKDQVLDELPPRTDITLEVELNSDEAAFYESVRQQAINRMDNIAGNASAGTKHVTVLAELMKLRRCCCNPKLIMPDWSKTGSKLALFADTVDELIENQHKALVFSQFVDHLTIIRECLDEKGIAYQYLDGSTSPKKRQEAVDAFQAGEGDIFLISLKAGGVGLNLTAADYVFHLDPWWNPAVEDQASDRAHRIGQQRPVTVYRFVTKGTVEEQIVQLHHEKRDLAQNLLDGAEMSGKMSTDQLIELLKGG